MARRPALAANIAPTAGEAAAPTADESTPRARALRANHRLRVGPGGTAIDGGGGTRTSRRCRRRLELGWRKSRETSRDRHDRSAARSVSPVDDAGCGSLVNCRRWMLSPCLPLVDVVAVSVTSGCCRRVRQRVTWLVFRLWMLSPCELLEDVVALSVTGKGCRLSLEDVVPLCVAGNC